MPKIAATQEELVYRIVQESITNSISHGNATEIEIRMDNDGSSLFISICDNGCGCASPKEGFGLTNIRERVEYFKGSVSIVTSPGKGFSLHITMPLIRSPAYD
jgi:signal transduction histidine kinase